ncbi:MAG: preprotein translocase subunit SecE [Patescibacteria group bacterium]|nr:preprotein translocase subunit SecE [Patescibacteria group bacterium]
MNSGEKIKTFFKEVATEGKKVDWPSRQKTLRYTAIVIGISAGVAIFLGALDLLFVTVLGKFFL